MSLAGRVDALALRVGQEIKAVRAEGGGGGGLPLRQSVTYTTASLTTGAREVGTVTLGSAWRLFSVSTSRAARVRLYDTVTHRDADVNRSRTTSPDIATNHGVLLDMALPAAALALGCSPVVDGIVVGGGSAAPITIDNLGAAGTVAVTFTFVKAEG